MLDPKTLEELGSKMTNLLANSPARDLEKNARAAMSGLLAKLDVVTREARVEALEKARSAQ